MNRAKTEQRSRCTTRIVTTLAAALLSCTAHATTFTWDGQMTSSWGYSRNVGSYIVPTINSNWEPDGYSSLLLPTSSDKVVFGEFTTSNRTVNLNGSRSIGSLEFKNAQSFSLTNGSLALFTGDLTSTSTFAQTIDANVVLQGTGFWDVSWAPVTVNGQLYSNYDFAKVGLGPLYLTNKNNHLGNTFINEGTFKIQDGASLQNENGYVGDAYGKLGVATVTGEASTWTNTDSFYVGGVGRGRFEIVNNGTVSTTNGYVGNSVGSSGLVTVDGINSTWSASKLHIGEQGQGTLNIRGGGTVTSDNTALGYLTGGAGTATVTGTYSTWNTGNLYVGNNGEGTLNIENGGTVFSDHGSIGNSGTSTNIATVTGANSSWNITGPLYLSFIGVSSILNIEDGGTVSNTYADMGGFDVDFTTSIVTVTGANSRWINSGSLKVGIGADLSDISTSGYTVNIETGGTVSVGNEIHLNSNGEINLLGGTLRTTNFEFAQDKAINFDTGKLHLRQNTVINTSNIYSLDVDELSNGKTLRVDGITTLQTPLTLNGGTLSTDSIAGFNYLDFQSGTFEQTLGVFTIGSAGNAGPYVYLSSGKHIAITNNAHIAADGTLNLSGGTFSAAKLTNNGTIIASGGTNLFLDDVVHNGLEIRTNAGSKSLFYGSYTGAGNFTGPGDVYFGGDFRPGNSVDIVNFEGDVHLNYSNSLTVELAGLLSGEFDQLVIAGDTWLAGTLAIDLLEGFTLSSDNEFEIIDIAGTLSGQFFGLGEGDLVGTFGGEDLFISYAAGDGNDVALFTAGLSGDHDGNNVVDGFDFLKWQRGESPQPLSSFGLVAWEQNFGGTSSGLAFFAAVPEPATLFLAVIASLVATIRRQRI